MAVESVEIVLNGVDNASPVVDKVTQKLISNEEKYISKLKEQLIAQTQGAVAAERFKLAEMGFSEATIESAIAIKQQMEAAKEAAKAQDELEKQTREAAQEMERQAKQAADAAESQSLNGQLDRAKGQLDRIKGLVNEAAGMGRVIGEAINEWVLGASEFRAELERVNAENNRLANGVMQLQVRRIAENVKEISFLPQEEQAAAYAKQLAEINALVAMQEEELAAAVEREREIAKQTIVRMGFDKESLPNAQKVTAQRERDLDILKRQADELRQQMQPESELSKKAKERSLAEQENKKAIEDAKKANKDAWAELSKQMADEQKARDDQIKKDQSYLDGLKARNMELLNGKRAADEFKASLAGVTEETIAAGREMAIQNELIEAQKQLSDEQKRQDDELAKKMATPAPQLQAMQSRLLSRSGQSNTGERQAKANEKVAELTARIETLQREQQTLLSDIRNNTRNTIKVVS